MDSNDIFGLFRNILNDSEIYNAMENINIHLDYCYRKCLGHVEEETTNFDSEVLKLEIDSVVDFLHDEINTGHWSKVSLDVRRAFTAVSFVKALISIRSTIICDEQFMENVLKILDTGLLLGAPLLDNPTLLTDCAGIISQKIAAISDKPLHHVTSFEDYSSKLKRKLSSDVNSLLTRLPGTYIDTLDCPSIQFFNEKYFKTQIPVKITGCMTHWPAMKKWCDLNYFLRVAGDRTVPIELGSHYVDEEWSQKLITLKEFISKYFINRGDRPGYLAQHNLFDQISELKKDIHIPEYCCLSRNDQDYCEPDINAWFGPEGTVSPLHHDPKNNFLAQVFGTKQIILFSPRDSEFLYPYDSQMLSNTARVDPTQPDLEAFPLFKRTKMFKCLLEPGEMLFIPEKWWHHVTALEKSFSVSFWWK